MQSSTICCVVFPKCCQYVANGCVILPICCENVAKMLPICCQNGAKMLPKCCQNNAKIIPKCCAHLVRLPSSHRAVAKQLPNHYHDDLDDDYDEMMLMLRGAIKKKKTEKVGLLDQLFPFFFFDGSPNGKH